ncbi:hypothetical protein ACA910_013268 [Epithemia clementina (nom. ined.)]
MSSRLQLHLSARDLKNIAGLMGVSDPFAVVTVRGDSENNKPRVVGQTDVVFNNLNPSWSQVIFLDGYRFGVPFYFEVGVFDFDASLTNKTELELSRMDVHAQSVLTSAATSQQRGEKFPHRVMGTALFEVGQILGSRGNIASKSLQSGGVLTVHMERCQNAQSGRLHLHLEGHKIKPLSATSRSANTFYEMFRKVDRPTGAVWESVYRSNVVKHSLSPNWNDVNLDLDATCNGDLDRAIKIVVWDHKRSGKHKFMGECETTVHGLAAAGDNDGNSNLVEEFGFELMRDSKTVGRLHVKSALLSSETMAEGAPDNLMPEANGKANHINGLGVASTDGASVSTRRPEFVDYLSGGCQISLAVAIDFTASNGDPREPGTPHYFHPPQSKEWNDYEKAIFAVGSILAKYDSDQRMPVWGFGAKYNGVVRHCFQCGQEVEVEGVQGIMDAYRGVFRTPLTMSYPTKLTEVIETAASYARHEQETAQEESKLSYTILLILTSGNVENAKETKDCLISASDDPLSVVIVGIGDTDFTSMEFLDEHDPTTEGGRDITKFVRFGDYRSFNALTEAVLDEIPQQLVDYYYSKNIMPGQMEDFNEHDVQVAEADNNDRTSKFLG